MIKRRKFIEGVSALGVATAVAPFSSCQPSEGVPEEKVPEKIPLDNQTYRVYRFQTRNRRACKACKKHGRYKIFLSSESADTNRAHPGCNCGIVEQTISSAYYQQITPFELNGMIDLRGAFNYV